jgi:hypothetical protein
VRQEIDRRGNPIRNRKSVKYSACFFRKVAKTTGDVATTVAEINIDAVAVGGVAVSIDASIAVAVDPLL